MVKASYEWVWILTAAAILLASVLQPFVPFEELSRDPSAQSWERGGKIHIYTGAISLLGLMVWAATAAVTAFRAAQLPQSDTSGFRRFFLASALLSAFLLFDDAFSFHETIAPHFGVPEVVIVALLAAATAAHLFFHRSQFLSGSNLLIGMTFFLLPFAAAYDFVFPGGGSSRYFFEDGAKFLGIWTWAGFHIDLALRTQYTE